MFLDGSAYYFDEFMRKVTGFYRVMYGSVNGHPHYVARNCKNPDEYGTSCTYLWYSGYVFNVINIQSLIFAVYKWDHT